MRVIHISAYYAPAYVYGGPVRSVHALCKAQQAYGLDVEVFTTTANGVQRLGAAPEGRRFDGIFVRYFDLSSPALLLGSAELPVALARALPGADVVHLHGLFNRTIWDAAACVQAAGTPYVLSPRGMLEAPALAHHRWRKRLTWTLRDRAIVQRASLLHATAAFEEATLRRLQAAPVVRIPNPVPVTETPASQSQRWRASLGIPADAPLVLSLGRMHSIKRLDLVAAAFVRLRQQVPTAHLAIAGPDEQGLRPALENQLATVADGVHWIGPVHDVTKHAILAAATVLVQCSDSESFGMSVAEALAAGTPVVVTRTCPWEEIEKAGCGFWVDQSAAAISDALCTLISNPDLLRAQGEAASRFVRERLAPARVAEAWHAAYRDAACSSPAAA